MNTRLVQIFILAVSFVTGSNHSIHAEQIQYAGEQFAIERLFDKSPTADTPEDSIVTDANGNKFVNTYVVLINQHGDYKVESTKTMIDSGIYKKGDSFYQAKKRLDSPRAGNKFYEAPSNADKKTKYYDFAFKYSSAFEYEVGSTGGSSNSGSDFIVFPGAGDQNAGGDDVAGIQINYEFLKMLMDSQEKNRIQVLDPYGNMIILIRDPHTGVIRSADGAWIFNPDGSISKPNGAGELVFILGNPNQANNAPSGIFQIPGANSNPAPSYNGGFGSRTISIPAEGGFDPSSNGAVFVDLRGRPITNPIIIEALRRQANSGANGDGGEYEFRIDGSNSSSGLGVASLGGGFSVPGFPVGSGFKIYGSIPFLEIDPKKIENLSAIEEGTESSTFKLNGFSVHNAKIEIPGNSWNDEKVYLLSFKDTDGNTRYILAPRWFHNSFVKGLQQYLESGQLSEDQKKKIERFLNKSVDYKLAKKEGGKYIPQYDIFDYQNVIDEASFQGGNVILGGDGSVTFKIGKAQEDGGLAGANRTQIILRDGSSNSVQFPRSTPGGSVSLPG